MISLFSQEPLTGSLHTGLVHSQQVLLKFVRYSQKSPQVPELFLQNPVLRLHHCKLLAEYAKADTLTYLAGSPVPHCRAVKSLTLFYSNGFL